MECTLKKCFNRPTPDRRCEWCRAKWRAYGLKRRRELAKLGKCVNDGNNRAPGKMTCQRCLDRCVERSRRLRARNMADSVCMRCATPVGINPKTGIPYAKCEACRRLYKNLYPKRDTQEAAE